MTTAAYLLDANTFRLYKAGHPAVMLRVADFVDALCLSSVTVEEMVVGRLSLINRARSGKGGIRVSDAHAAFAELLADVQPFPLLAYGEAADAVYRAFSAATIRIGAQDCRIAAQAIAHNMTVVTRNVRDFEAIGAPCADWSV